MSDSRIASGTAAKLAAQLAKIRPELRKAIDDRNAAMKARAWDAEVQSFREASPADLAGGSLEGWSGVTPGQGTARDTCEAEGTRAPRPLTSERADALADAPAAGPESFLWPSLGDEPDPFPAKSARKGPRLVPEAGRAAYGAAAPSKGPAREPGDDSEEIPPEASGAPPGATRLDTWGVSVQATESAGRSRTGWPVLRPLHAVGAVLAGWIMAVGEGTAQHRAKRAAHFRARGRRVRAQALQGPQRGAGLQLVRQEGEGARLAGNAEGYGVSEREADRAAAWYVSRAKGQEQRTEMVLACGKNGKTRVTHCQSCNSNTRAPDVCGVWLACESCRGRLVKQRRQKIGASLEEWRFRARRAGLLNEKRRGGRWALRMMTLTLPHDAPGVVQTVVGRVEQFRKAWKHFRKLLAVHLRHRVRETRGDEALLHWYAAFEWTAGADRIGHPHAHVAMASPYVVKATIEDFWRWSLEHAGIGELQMWGRRMRPIYDGPIVCDIAEAYGPDPAAELCKYIIKAIDTGGRLDPELYAQAYEALDGKRSYSGSPGFLSLAMWAPECSCGVSGCFTVRFERTPDPIGEPDDSSRGPPEPLEADYVPLCPF